MELHIYMLMLYLRMITDCLYIKKYHVRQSRRTIFNSYEFSDIALDVQKKLIKKKVIHELTITLVTSKIKMCYK